MRSQLFANFHWLAADRIIRIVGSLVIGIWVARYLGPGDYGLLNFAFSFVALFGVVGKLNIDPVAVRELTRFPEKEREILGSVFRLKFWGSLAAAVLVLPAAWLAQSDNHMFLLLVLISAVGLVFNAFDTIDIFYQAKVLSKYVVQARTLAFLVLAAARIILIFCRFSITWFALATLLELVIGAGLMAYLYHRREGRTPRWHWDGNVARQLLRDGWPLMVSSMLVIVHTRIDQVMIGHMLGEVQAGLYSVAVRVSEAWFFVPSLAVQTLLPYFVTLKEINFSRYQQRLLQLYSAMLWAGVAAGLAALTFGHTAIILLFGNAYEGAYGALVLTIWTGIFIAQSVARGIWLVSENLQLFRLLNNLIAVPINVALNMILIPSYGISGAAAASLVSIGLGTWVVPLFFSQMRRSSIDLIISVNPRYLLLREENGIK